MFAINSEARNRRRRIFTLCFACEFALVVRSWNSLFESQLMSAWNFNLSINFKAEVKISYCLLLTWKRESFKKFHFFLIFALILRKRSLGVSSLPFFINIFSFSIGRLNVERVFPYETFTAACGDVLIARKGLEWARIDWVGKLRQSTVLSIAIWNFRSDCHFAVDTYQREKHAQQWDEVFLIRVCQEA